MACCELKTELTKAQCLLLKRLELGERIFVPKDGQLIKGVPAILVDSGDTVKGPTLKRFQREKWVRVMSSLETGAMLGITDKGKQARREAYPSRRGA